jgi:hypothetical protein
VGHGHSARRLRRLTGRPGCTVSGLNKSQINPNLIQTCPNLLWSKQDFPVPQNFEIKYCWKVFEIKNDFPYRDFLIFEMGFELKFTEASMGRISRKI